MTSDPGAGQRDLRDRRVLLLAIGTHGDVEPAARLAQALIGADAHVLVAVLADGAARVAAAGATPLVVGPPAAQAMWWRSPAARAVARVNPGIGYLQLRTRLAAQAGQIATSLVPALRGADVVLAGLATARVVPILDRAGIPARLLLHAPLVPHPGGTSGFTRPASVLLPDRVEQDRQQVMWRMTTGLSRAIAAQVQRQLGLGAEDALPAPTHTDLAATAHRPLLTTSPVLDPDPAPRLVQTGFWADPSPERPLDPQLDRWLDEHPDAVLLTQGSFPLTKGEALVERLLGVARDVGRPALLQLPSARPGPRAGGLVIGAADHRVLLRRLAAAVHHGGSGTTHVVTASGIPQVVVPHLGDQPHYAHQVHRLGLGPAPLPAPRASRRALSRRLAAALADPAHRSRAKDAAAAMTGEAGLSRALAEVGGMLA